MCTGNGKIDSSLLLVDTIENKIDNLTKVQKGEIKIATHPFVASHINKGLFFSSIRHNWAKKYDRKIIIISDERLHLLQYSVVK
jgi:ribonuclease G